ncbi:hypothetical protein AB1Y20_011616 [Prymnesium parvum]|uniref:PSII 6.1 kDa protein n=1 Tax=Prymnesium parvum TaxID=97485 RepID=A0AB34IJL3_PRYPA
MLRAVSLLLGLASAAGFQLSASRASASRAQVSMGLGQELKKIPAAYAAASVALYQQAAEAKSVLGVNGALDFGPLAGDQPGGEGTGKALGVNDDTLFGIIIAIPVIIGFLFTQWQGYQNDDDDFFDTYDSRREDREITNRNRV